MIPPTLALAETKGDRPVHAPKILWVVALGWILVWGDRIFSLGCRADTVDDLAGITDG
jgi:hypothetical protein